MDFIFLSIVFAIGFFSSILGIMTGSSGLIRIPLLIILGLPPQMAIASNPMFKDFKGIIDSNGHATAQLNMPPLSPGYVGGKLYFALCCYNPYILVTNPVVIEIVQ